MKEESVTTKQEQPTEAKSMHPDSGQVPVAMPMPMVAKHPEMPMTQVYAPHISVASLLLLMLIGVVLFKIRAERRRLAKRCPHCKAGLERWADSCGMCNKSIFVYPPLERQGN